MLRSNPDDVGSILKANGVNWGEEADPTQENRVQAAATVHVSSIPEESLLKSGSGQTSAIHGVTVET